MSAASKKKHIAQVLAHYGHEAPPRGVDELVAWLRASTVAGFALPAAIDSLVDAACHLQDQRDALVRPERSAAQLAEAALTMTAAEILTAREADAQAAAQHVQQVDIITKGETTLGWRCSDVFKAERDGLIVGPLRAAVAATIDAAKEIADALKQYAPAYTSGLLAEGTEAELILYRESRKLQATLATLQHTWWLSFGRAAGQGTSIDVGFRPERSGGVYAWSEPESVLDADLRLGHSTEILLIASAPTTYRLIGPSEFVTLLAELQSEHDAAAKATTGVPSSRSPFDRIKVGMVAGR